MSRAYPSTCLLILIGCVSVSFEFGDQSQVCLCLSTGVYITRFASSAQSQLWEPVPDFRLANGDQA